MGEGEAWWYAAGLRHGRNRNVTPMAVPVTVGTGARRWYASGFSTGRRELRGTARLGAGGSREPRRGAGASPAHGVGVRRRVVPRGTLEALLPTACGDVWGIQSWGALSQFFDNFREEWKQPDYVVEARPGRRAGEEDA